MTAKEIIKLLADKHAKDVFVPEAKAGSSWAGCPRLDGWAMKRSWSPLTMIGYEVKVSRSDFLGDSKWPGYLKFCHEFYFVCPAKLIQKEELPENVGLLWVASTGTRLYTKRKASRREDIDPTELLAYLLMSRAQIVGNMWKTTELTGVEKWERWLSDNKKRRRLGFEISKTIRGHVDEVEKENRLLKAKMDSYDGLRQRIVELGFDPDKDVGSWGINRRLDAVCGAVPKDLIWQLQQLYAGIGKTITAIESLRGGSQ